MGALLGEPGGGSFTGDPEGYERKALGTGIFFHGGSVGPPGVGSSIRYYERWLEGALEVERLSLSLSLSLSGGSSVKGTWRKGSLAGDHEGYV